MTTIPGSASVSVRSATRADVPRVLPMVEGICRQHEHLDPARYRALADVVQRYERWLPERAADPRSVFLVAEAKADLVGFVVATVERNIPIYVVEEFAFVHDLWVEPVWRGRGAGGKLLREAAKRFAALGVTQVRGSVAWANHTPRRLLESLGYRPCAVEYLLELGASASP